MKKPPLQPGSPSFLNNVKTWFEIIAGRRGNSVTRITLAAPVVAAAPTAEEFNALRADVARLTEAVNTLVDRLEG